jgi:serine/threonine protein kinase
MDHERPSDDSASEEPAIRAQRFGRYTLIKKLATGGMAEIWLASQKGVAGFTRFVVIKKILSHLGEQETFVKMFLDEARTCSQLSHPNIVQIYDLGREGSTYFIAMEYIAGENLAALAWRSMKRQKPLSPTIAAKLIADAAKALHYAHQMRGANGQPLHIVHRDVSPQNILVTYEGEVKLVDFGIAKAASKSEQTKTGMLKGKFAYMSPEQCLGEDLDGRSDIFALGIVLYEMCTGKRLFKHDSELMILDMITRRPIVPPSQVAAGVPPALEAIIMKALEKPVSTRFSTAQEMQLQLEELVRRADRPITNADIAAYMKSLFEDKILEKKRLVEAAAREDFATIAEEEQEHTDQKQPMRPGSSKSVRRGAPPLDPSRSGPEPSRSFAPQDARPSIQSGTGATPPMYASTQYVSQVGPPGISQMTPMPMQAMSYAGYAGVMAPAGPRSWVLPAVIALALLVIAGALVVILYPTSAPAPPLRQGSISVVSRPAGAFISLEGQPLLDAGKHPLVTPVELKFLNYGASYKVRLEMRDRMPAERMFVMNEASDKTELSIALDPTLGTVIGSVAADEPEKVDVYLGSDRAGSGPSFKIDRPPGRVTVSARYQGKPCTADPEAIDVVAGQTHPISIVCRRARPSSGPVNAGGRMEAPRAEGPTEERREPPPPPKRSAASGDCVADESLPVGYITVDSSPYADIYIGSKKIGQTPLARKELPAGCVIIRAVNPDSGKEKLLKLEVKSGLVTIYNIEL